MGCCTSSDAKHKEEGFDDLNRNSKNKRKKAGSKRRKQSMHNNNSDDVNAESFNSSGRRLTGDAANPMSPPSHNKSDNSSGGGASATRRLHAPEGGEASDHGNSSVGPKSWSHDQHPETAAEKETHLLSAHKNGSYQHNHHHRRPSAVRRRSRSNSRASRQRRRRRHGRDGSDDSLTETEEDDEDYDDEEEEEEEEESHHHHHHHHHNHHHHVNEDDLSSITSSTSSSSSASEGRRSGTQFPKEVINGEVQHENSGEHVSAENTQAGSFNNHSGIATAGLLTPIIANKGGAPSSYDETGEDTKCDEFCEANLKQVLKAKDSGKNAVRGWLGRLYLTKEMVESVRRESSAERLAPSPMAGEAASSLNSRVSGMDTLMQITTDGGGYSSDRMAAASPIARANNARRDGSSASANNGSFGAGGGPGSREISLNRDVSVSRENNFDFIHEGNPSHSASAVVAERTVNTRRIPSSSGAPPPAPPPPKDGTHDDLVNAFGIDLNGMDADNKSEHSAVSSSKDSEWMYQLDHLHGEYERREQQRKNKGGHHHHHHGHHAHHSKRHKSIKASDPSAATSSGHGSPRKHRRSTVGSRSKSQSGGGHSNGNHHNQQ